MKIRNGFVSNSSSSSFCIYGTSVDIDGNIEEMIENTGLEIHNYYDTIYVGRSWSSIKDDETGAQFKESVNKALKNLGIDAKCGTCEEAWFDG